MKKIVTLFLMVTCTVISFASGSDNGKKSIESPNQENFSVSAIQKRNWAPEAAFGNTPLTGNSWLTKTRVVYQINENSVLEESGKSVYEASSDGRLQKSSKYSWIGGTWVQTSEAEYKWNNGFLEKSFFTSFKTMYSMAGIWESYYRYENGLMVKNEEFNISETRANPKYETYFLYNDLGLKCEQIDYVYVEGVKVKTERQKYTYGKNSEITSKAIYRYSGGYYEFLSDSTFYENDSSEVLQSVNYKSFQHPESSTFDRYLYSESKDNILIKKYGFDSNGKNWGIQFRERFLFQDDNLREMSSEYYGNVTVRNYKWDSQNRISECKKTYNGEEIERIVFSYEKVTSVSDFFVPENLDLISGYPNPFNPSTTLKWNQPVSGTASILVTNLLGQTVRTEFVHSTAGKQTHQLEMGGFGSGVYFVRIESGGRFSNVLKLILLK
ncbi:MAG: T9SS type A sorting domain-containing protein [Bacteroidetes bacterium]|nr:T9SS type A sorting domain-containing protein [Bacteroidota bacterium]